MTLPRWMSELREGRAWMTNVLLCVIGMALLLLARQFVVESDHFVIGESGVSGWSAWLYIAAVVVVLTQPLNRATFGIVIGFAIAFRMMTLFADPFSSSDIYRYVWDGIVQHAHINPYRYVPGDTALNFLHANNAGNQDVFDGINRRNYARTIYPPFSQMIYWTVTFFSPTVQGMKAAMFGFECVTTGALLAMLRLMGRPRAEVLLYAWCPLLVWEIGGAGHIDAAVFCLIALALLFRWKEMPVLTGLFLGAAIMTKFYPLVLFPALYKRGDWKMPATVAAVVAAGYAMYSSVGMLVFGFLSGYQKEEGIDSGARFFLLDLVQHIRGLEHFPKAGYYIFCAAVLGVICWWAWRHATTEDSSRLNVLGRVPNFIRAAMMLGFAMMLLFSPHYPWYIVWLIPLFALAPNMPLLAYLLAFFYMFTTALADGTAAKMYVLNEILYGAVAGAFVLHFIFHRWPVMRFFKIRDDAAVL
jgi:alpha-1,6-mannosyltransferase